jgi:caa(3)-type oxidase subunit IV
MSETKQHSWNAYFVVFNALLLLTVITVGLSYIDLGEILSEGSLWGAQMTYGVKWLPTLPVVEIGHGANVVLGLIVASIKASLVVWYFMHMDHETLNNRFVLAFSIALMLLAFGALAFDFVWLGTYAGAFASAALGN